MLIAPVRRCGLFRSLWQARTAVSDTAALLPSPATVIAPFFAADDLVLRAMLDGHIDHARATFLLRRLIRAVGLADVGQRAGGMPDLVNAIRAEPGALHRDLRRAATGRLQCAD